MNKVHFYFFLFSPLVWVCLVIKGVVHCNSQRASHVTSPFFFFFIFKEFFSLFSSFFFYRRKWPGSSEPQAGGGEGGGEQVLPFFHHFHGLQRHCCLYTHTLVDERARPWAREKKNCLFVFFEKIKNKKYTLCVTRFRLEIESLEIKSNGVGGKGIKLRVLHI